MAGRHTTHGYDVWTIVSPDGGTKASFVPELGGTGSSLVMPGPDGPRELLYLHDHFWDRSTKDLRGGWPFLFPICGRVELDGKPDTYEWAGVSRYMSIHGFGPRVPWQAVDTGRPDEIALELYDSDATRAKYPFSFVVTLRYRVLNGELQCRMSVKNASGSPMPYYMGFHPYFQTPPPGHGKEDVTVSCVLSRCHRYNEQFTAFTEEKEHPAMPMAPSHPDFSRLLLEPGLDRTARLSFPDGYELSLSTESNAQAELFPYVQLYTVPEEPFLCVEPWMGYPNMLNCPDAVRTLAPRATDRATLRLRAHTADGD